MKMKIKLAAVLICLVYILQGASDLKIPAEAKGETTEEKIRAVWIATNFGLDFPKNPTPNSSSLKGELNSLIKSAKDLGFNTVYFQVRPGGDAFYKSNFYPWSVYLTGKEGLAPEGNFDPLEYVISLCREKNLKIHAWINPYRLPLNKSDASLCVEANHPNWVIETGGKKYLNPGLPEVCDFVAEGAAEIARGYDVDGIQIDDYFYPEGDFPDDWSYETYGKDFEDKASWRRNNIDTLIKKMNDAIKKENKNILFGVSPQGIWANSKNISGGSETSGKEAFFSSYANTKKWVEEEMIDYIIPQIYWNIGYAGADFKVVANWWNSVAKGKKTKLIFGMAAYKAADCTDLESVWYKSGGAFELEKQASLSEGLENVSGTAMYRLESVIKSDDVRTSVMAINGGKISVFYDLTDCLWAKDDILFLYEKGIVGGMGDGTFGGSLKVTRGQFAVMLSRILNKETKFENNFSDVEKGKYYYDDIGKLKAFGLIKGQSDDKFNPEGKISRQDMATMAHRILVSEGIIAEENHNLEFSDKVEIGDYAKSAVGTFSKMGTLNGYEDGSFNPKGEATRAECSVFLKRIYDIMANTLEKSEN